MDNIFNRRLIVNMGKGGVGRSLVSAALVLNGLRRNKRVLVVQVNADEKISRYLGCEQASSEVREVMPGLHSVNIKPSEALKEYALMQVRLEVVYRLVFENKAVKYFLRAVPALNDLLILGKILFHVKQQDDDGKPLYDMIIVDAPPTGHGLFLLNIPKVMRAAVKTGPINREVKEMYEILIDPCQTAINLVALAEEMPVTETIELYKKISQEFNMPLGWLFINGIFPRVFPEDEEDLILDIAEKLDVDDNLRCMMDNALMSILRRRLNERYVEKLADSISLPTVKLPFFLNEEFDRKVVDQVADIIDRESEGFDCSGKHSQG